jgi:hypothetical protein
MAKSLYLQGKSPDSHKTGAWVCPRTGLDVVDYRNISALAGN